MTIFAPKRDTEMHQQEINIRTLNDKANIHVGYSDNDVVIVESIQKFAENTSSHMSMIAIAVCVSGRAEAMIGGRKIELCKNEISIIPPNAIMTDFMVSPDFDMKAVFLTSAILQSFMREKMNVWNEMLYIHEVRCVKIDDGDLELFKTFYDLLQVCFRKPDDMPFRTEILQSLLRVALLAVCGAMIQQTSKNIVLKQHNPSKAISVHFQGFLDLLHTEENKHRTVQYYAKKLSITPKYLTTLCRKYTGKTANQWITEQLLEDIRYYLRHTDMNIKQVSEKLGFPNNSFFGKFVREHFGMTPLQFRGYKENVRRVNS